MNWIIWISGFIAIWILATIPGVWERRKESSEMRGEVSELAHVMKRNWKSIDDHELAQLLTKVEGLYERYLELARAKRFRNRSGSELKQLSAWKSMLEERIKRGH